MRKNTTRFLDLAKLFSVLENTSSSLAMIDALSGFFPNISPREGKIVAYLVQGQIGPLYEGLDFGVAEKLAMKAIAHAQDVSLKKVESLYQKEGDLGNVAEIVFHASRSSSFSIERVFADLKSIAECSGTGSQEKKITILSDLLCHSSALEARYIVRLVLGTLRLGVGEMTFLYGLSKALTGTKEKKKELEAIFNVCSDLGEVAYNVLAHGISHTGNIHPVTGIPVRMMLAQRVQEIEEAKKHIPGPVAVEYKYDGERVQAHIHATGDVTLFSRRHENITHQFPDIADALKRSFSGTEAIVEGEAVAIDAHTGALKHFQVLMTRRRKHHIEEYVKNVPVKYFLFDVLSLNGKSLLDTPFQERVSKLKRACAPSRIIDFARQDTVQEKGEIERFFARSLQDGAEGIMIKDARGVYEAGSRGWKWIKFKKDYGSELADTFDLVVVGALFGSGRRGGTYGSLLVASYNPKTNTYHSFTKVGAGFTDKDLEKIKKRLNSYKIKEKHKLVKTGMRADVWFDPVQVVEVEGTEITLSPIHTVAQEKMDKGGLALRFPRFLRWREDKSAQQTTTTQEIYRMYKNTV